MKGEIIGENNSRILVKMRLHIIVIFFLVFITLLILWSLIKNNLHNGGLIVLPVIYIFFTYQYLKESKKYKKKFESYFK